MVIQGCRGDRDNHDKLVVVKGSVDGGGGDGGSGQYCKMGVVSVMVMVIATT